MVTLIQVLLIFGVVRLLMVVMGVTLFHIPGVDWALGKLVATMRVWFG